jgi:hypothetical protein
VKKERNYYLIGLAIFGTLFISGLAYMLRIAFSNPVEMDSSHMMPYRELDKNYNQIAESEKKFNEKYVVGITKVLLNKDTSANLELNISDKSGAAVDANITALVTRPDTSKHDIKITDFNKTSTGYVSKPFVVGLEGRWKVMYKIEVGGVQKFVDFETFANKAIK